MTYKRTDGNQKVIIKALRRAGKKAFPTHMVGDGFPDVAVKDGCRIILMEVKMPGEPLTPAEQKFFDEWRGAPIFKVESPEEALRICDGER